MRSLDLRVLGAVIHRDVIGFCYHTVSDRALPHIASLYPCKTVAQFKRDLEYLQRQYRVIGYDELSTSRSASRGSPPRILITFDDGLAECYDIVRPVLLEYGLQAIFFVTTEFLDNRRLFYRQKVALCVEAYSHLTTEASAAARADVGRLFHSTLNSSSQLVAQLRAATWEEEPAIDAVCALLGVDVEGFLRACRPYLSVEQVRALALDGFTIGAHGTSHRHLGTMTTTEAENEIISSCETISRMVQAATVPFAFPFNGRGVSRDMMDAVRKTHADVGLFFDSTELAHDREFVINRLVVDDPAAATATGSNLKSRLRKAYLREIVRPILRPRQDPA